MRLFLPVADKRVSLPPMMVTCSLVSLTRGLLAGNKTWTKIGIEGSRVVFHSVTH